MQMSIRSLWFILATLLVLSSCGGGGGGDSDSTAAQADLDRDGVIDSRDVDDDNDGLIEISSLQQLDLMRNDLAGTSLKDHVGNTSSAGCPASGCNGYELVTDLDFDTNGDGVMDANDAFFNYDGPGSATGWLPVGTNGNPFQANFNGNGHTISNLYIDRAATDYVGLFGSVSSASNPVEINGLHLDGPWASITGREYVGGLAGYAHGAVTFSNNNAAGDVTGSDYNVGGLVGYAQSAVTFSGNSVSGSVTGNNFYVGGLVGYAYDSVSFSHNSASATVKGNVYVGGLVGSAENSVTFSDNSASADVSGDNAIGGLVGTAINDVTINNSYATGDVTATGNFTGGLVGRANANTGNTTVAIQRSFATSAVTSTSSYVGGLVGISYKLDVDDTFATGSVSGVNYVGGLVGDANQQTSITKSFAVNNVTGSSSVGSFVGWSDTVTYESNYFSTTTTPAGGIGTLHAGSVPAGALNGRTTSQMKCPTRAADPAPACTANMYADWDSTSSGGDRVLWNYGTSMQLPGLILGGVVFRDGDADGTLD